jgi:hypothetical protein
LIEIPRYNLLLTDLLYLPNQNKITLTQQNQDEEESVGFSAAKSHGKFGFNRVLV